MSPSRRFLLDEIARHGYVRAADHPVHARTLRRMAADGAVEPLLGTFYALRGECRPVVLARIVCQRHPGAIVVGPAAAALTFWPDLRTQTVSVAQPRGRATSRPPFVFARRQVPPELRRVTGHYTVTSPALTALDLCDELGGDGIDQALRMRATTLDQLREALELTRGRRGNQDRRRLLLDSRDEPWSAAERLLHRALREARLTGWVANHPIPSGPTGCYFADVAFPARKVIIEVEGHRFHRSPDQLHRDRERQNHLTALGWLVVRVDWPMLANDPDAVVRLVETTLRLRRRAG